MELYNRTSAAFFADQSVDTLFAYEGDNDILDFDIFCRGTISIGASSPRRQAESET